MVMRNTTLLPTATGWLVGLSTIFVTFNAAEFTASVTLEVFVAVTPLAVAELVAVPVASVVNETVMFVLWPGKNAPRLFQVRLFAVVLLGVTLAEVKLN